ncbi:hypothetical protein T492DRAFT_924538 [Pavlovales sp. CCMP2436]|nr:hypothetical protein T492DRAFT_924538 [Pavlovales sp. CCMP2436]
MPTREKPVRPPEPPQLPPPQPPSQPPLQPPQPPSQPPLHPPLPPPQPPSHPPAQPPRGGRLFSDFALSNTSLGQRRVLAAANVERAYTLPPPPDNAAYYPLRMQADGANAQRLAYHSAWSMSEEELSDLRARMQEARDDPRYVDKPELLIAERPDLLQPGMDEGEVDGSCSWHKLHDLDKNKAMFKDQKNLKVVKGYLDDYRKRIGFLTHAALVLEALVHEVKTTLKEPAVATWLEKNFTGPHTYFHMNVGHIGGVQDVNLHIEGKNCCIKRAMDFNKASAGSFLGSIFSYVFNESVQDVQLSHALPFNAHVHCGAFVAKFLKMEEKGTIEYMTVGLVRWWKFEGVWRQLIPSVKTVAELHSEHKIPMEESTMKDALYVGDGRGFRLVGVQGRLRQPHRLARCVPPSHAHHGAARAQVLHRPP